MLARSFNTDTRASLNRQINLLTTEQKKSFFESQNESNQSFNHKTKVITLSTTEQCNLSFNYRTITLSIKEQNNPYFQYRIKELILSTTKPVFNHERNY
jgi:hypothetical protein